MSNVGQRERLTQQRVVKLFETGLGYRYLGNREDRAQNQNIEEGLLTSWLAQHGYSAALINRAMRQLKNEAALGEGKKSYVTGWHLSCSRLLGDGI